MALDSQYAQAHWAPAAIVLCWQNYFAETEPDCSGIAAAEAEPRAAVEPAVADNYSRIETWNS